MTRLRRRPRPIPLPILLACPALLALLGATAAAQDGALSSRVRERMQRFVDQKQIAGAVTLVGTADRVASREAAGQRQLEDDLPMRPDTLFRIASMTKPVTAIGVMMLADEGRLSVDDPVEKHLPEFKGQMLVASRPDDGTVTLK